MYNLMILQKDKIRVELDAHQLRKKDKFYDAVLDRTGVWLPDMKVNEFNALMSEVYKTRNIEEADDRSRRRSRCSRTGLNLS
jgi:hypothetical protein